MIAGSDGVISAVNWWIPTKPSAARIHVMDSSWFRWFYGAEVCFSLQRRRSFAREIVAMVETVGLEKAFAHKGRISISNTNLPVLAKRGFVGF